MRHLWSVIGVTALLLMCVGCASRQAKAPAMYIQPTEFTQKEQQLLELFNADQSTRVFDFVVDDSVKGVQINQYRLVDGVWNSEVGGGNSSEQLTDTQGRIALTFDKLAEGLSYVLQTEHKNGGVSYQKDRAPIRENYGIGTSLLPERTEIAYDQEIVLAAQVFSAGSEIHSMNQYFFEHPEEYSASEDDEVYVVTVKFLQNEIE